MKRIILDNDASEVTSDETDDGINVSLCKLDTRAKNKLTGQHGDAGGGCSENSLMEGLRIRNSIDTLPEYLSSTYSNHRLNLMLGVPTAQYFGTDFLERRNVLQYLYSVWNLVQ